MAEVDLRVGVYDGGAFEQFRLWGDDVLLRVVDNGEVQVIEFTSEDREGPPPYPSPAALLEVAARHGLRLAP